MNQVEDDSYPNLEFVFDLKLFQAHLHLNMPQYVAAKDSL